jgi:hypothetical protein
MSSMCDSEQLIYIHIYIYIVSPGFMCIHHGRGTTVFVVRNNRHNPDHGKVVQSVATIHTTRVILVYESMYTIQILTMLIVEYLSWLVIFCR